MESAQTALKAPSKMIDGRMAVCNLASEGLTSNNILYVGGLSPETTSVSCTVRLKRVPLLLRRTQINHGKQLSILVLFILKNNPLRRKLIGSDYEFLTLWLKNEHAEE